MFAPAALRAGFSLTEAVVALTIVAVAVLSVGGAAHAAMRLLREAVLAQGAALEAEAVLDSLADARAVSVGMLARPPYTLSWTATDSAGLGLIELVVRYTRDGVVEQLGFDRRTVALPPRDTSVY